MRSLLGLVMGFRSVSGMERLCLNPNSGLVIIADQKQAQEQEDKVKTVSGIATKKDSKNPLEISPSGA